MAGITATGTGSGLDVEGIITKLMQVEAQPANKLNTLEASYQSRISALGSLKGVVSSLDSALAGLIPSKSQTATDKFSSFKASLADSSVGSATATSSAILGSYSLEVSQLATRHKLSTLAGLYTSKSAPIAEGTLQITLGDGSPHDIVIDSTNNTLEGLKTAIENAKIGVSATLVTFGVNSDDVRLSLSSDTVGMGGQMKLVGLYGMTGFGFDAANPPGELSEAIDDGGTPAQGAEFKLNGVAATSNSNTVSNMIEGVTFTLAKTNLGAATSISVTRDNTTALTAALTAIVKAFNEIQSAVSSLGGYNAETKQGGPLLGNSTLRLVSSSIRNAFQLAPSGLNSTTIKRLSDIGLQIQRNGTIVLNTAKLSTAANADFETVAALATAVGKNAKDITTNMLNSSGSITTAVDGAKSSVKDLGQRREILSRRLTQIEARYRKQFSTLDTLISNMRNTSTYLTQQLASLPGSSSSN